MPGGEPVQLLHQGVAGAYPAARDVTAQRRLRRHGPRRARQGEGAVGRGATFYFTLNAKKTP
jgi:hypothetical protein